MRYSSRTVNAIENLIWYSESTINFLSDCCQPFFHSISSSGCNFTEKTANFHDLFEWSSVNISTTTWKILMKLGQMWDKIDTNQTQKTKRQNSKPFLSYLASISQKSTKNRPKFTNSRFLSIFSTLKFFKFFYIVNLDNLNCFLAFAKNCMSKKIYFAFWRPSICEKWHFFDFYQL